MKLFKLLANIVSMFALASTAAAQIYPPYPDPGSSSIYYGIYPVSIDVPYGKDSASPFTYQLQFYIVNNTNNDYALSDFILTPVNPPTHNPVTVVSHSSDCGNRLKPRGKGGTCTINMNIKAVNNGDDPIDFDFKFYYSAGRSKAFQAAPRFTISFAKGAPIPSASRTVSFVNNCTYDVWFGISSGAVEAIKPVSSIKPPDPQSCLVDADCYPGSKCKNVQATPVLNHCLWENPAPSGSGNPFHLLANNGSGTINVDFPAYDNGITTAWNGGIAGRVGCSDSTSTACTIADCGANPSGTACPIADGFATPSTLAEFTFLTQNPVITATSGVPSDDTYDITVINGVTVPMSMKPTTVPWGGNSAPYTCGEPGAVTLPVGNTQLGACQWFNALPPVTAGNGAVRADFVWVDTTGSGSACPATTCTGGEVCGHTVTGDTVSTSTVCGPQLGYFSADAVCAIDKTFVGPFKCNSTIYENGSNYTYTQIYGCSAGDFKNSCYSKDATSACCGCQNWDSYTTVPSSTQSCGGISNSNWQALQITTSFLPWLKELCPTAYVFPYDDASSTFKCQDTDSNNNNVVDYTVTFCPA